MPPAQLYIQWNLQDYDDDDDDDDDDEAGGVVTFSAQVRRLLSCALR